ncbi:hypothetical protein [Leifsonia poae]|uniref:hypothetical protein n=1 Tax=Leifsonia poae TaxID=110933 RepID=UPI001CBCE0BD|nr:hypothetical protein [Leifsonia poae]
MKHDDTIGCGHAPLEVWASDSVLLSFDGRALEVFGFTDVQRFHIPFRPVVQFSGRSPV